jgi:tetratricopeptide (TPR) repeat protein
VQEALSGFKAIYGEVREGGDLQSLWELDHYLAEGLMELNELVETEIYLLEAMKISDTGLAEKARPRTTMSILYAKQGKIDLARRLLEEAEEVVPIGTFVFNRLWILAAKAHLAIAERSWESAWTHFARLVETLGRIGLRHTRAKALQSWADAHLLRRKPEDIVRTGELLNEAQNEFEAMGAPGYVEMIQFQLKRLDQLN